MYSFREDSVDNRHTCATIESIPPVCPPRIADVTIKLRFFLLAIIALCLSAAPALARPAHKQALAEYFGPYLPKKLNDCRTCHLPDPPGYKDGDDKPHNVFGARLVAVKKELKYAGKKTTIADRLDAIAEEDSDGDGVQAAVAPIQYLRQLSA